MGKKKRRKQEVIEPQQQDGSPYNQQQYGQSPYGPQDVEFQMEEYQEEIVEDKGCCKKVVPPWMVITGAFLSLCVASFDIVTDALLLQVFIEADEGERIMTYIIAGLIVLSGSLYLTELAYFFIQSQYYCCRNKKLKERNLEKYRKKRKKEEREITMMHESVTYILLIVEDIPMAVIIFMLSHPDFAHMLPVSCKIYSYVLSKNTFIDELKLLAAFVSSLWKGLQSLRYLCFCEWYGCKSDWAKLPCGCARGLRPVLAAVMCCCTAYVYFVFGRSFSLAEVKPSCLEAANGTLFDDVDVSRTSFLESNSSSVNITL